MMKKYNVEWTPTINALLSITKFSQNNEIKYIENIVKNHLKKVIYAKQKGVIINTGSDSGSKDIEHIKSYFKESKLINN